MNAVVPLHARMSDAEYEAERAKLRELYGESSTEAAAKRDQAMAILFYRSGWTQEELAKKEEKTQQWVALRIRFGRFLNFTTTVVNSDSLPKNLTERRFRSYWEQTNKAETNERIRFQAVIKMLRTEPVTSARRPPIGPSIKEHFADGKWHRLETVANKLETDEDHVRDTLDGISKNQTYGCKAEKKKVGTHIEYRIFKLDKTISSNELVEKLTPIIEGLEDQGRKNIVTMSPPQVKILAHRLRKLLDEWTE